jgi:acyl-CoA synthetase (AMP-forming)/AMP-acid ligase II
MIVSRVAELRTLDDLLAALICGEGGALIVHGEAGIGKTTLLEALAERARGAVTVVRACGAETEAELAFAALTDLLSPLLRHLDALPVAQAAVLMGALALEPPTPGDRLAALHDHHITQTVVVPPIVHALARHPAVDQYDLSSLQWLGCGAAPLGAELQLACAQRIGCPVGQGYGMTEATACIALWPAGTPVVPGSSGQLLPGVQARIIDPDTGADRNRGETGELWVRTPR